MPNRSRGSARYYKRHHRGHKKSYQKKPFFTHPKPVVPAVVVEEEPVHRIPPLTAEEINERRSHYACGTNFFTLDSVTHLDQWMKQNNVTYNKETTPFKPSQCFNKKIGTWIGDLTKLEIDAIVNAANCSLMGGGGIDGCIHRAAGPKLREFNATLGGCKTGEAKLSPGFNLPARYVVSTVGPTTEDKSALRQCYISCLDLAAEKGIGSIAFCCISTGIYGFANDVASDVAIGAVREWLEIPGNERKIDLIVFGLFMKVDIDLYNERLPHYFPPSN